MTLNLVPFQPNPAVKPTAYGGGLPCSLGGREGMRECGTEVLAVTERGGFNSRYMQGRFCCKLLWQFVQLIFWGTQRSWPLPTA